jgi:predicted DNA binding protein
MATIADFELSPEEFALRQTLETVPDAQFETVCVAAHSADSVLPLVLGTAPTTGQNGLVDALRADPSVANLEVLTRFNGEALFKMEWASDIAVLVDVLCERDATILAAHGTSDGWQFRGLFPVREALAATYEFCRDNGLSLDIHTIHDLTASEKRPYGLSLKQQETLTIAFDAGYYDVPRSITLSELSEETGISHQALSERLRRGHGNLIENTLAAGRPTPLEARLLADSGDDDLRESTQNK